MDAATRRVKRGWINLKVTKVIEETWDCKTFIMEDLEEGGRTWDYWSGQYLTFRYDDVAEKPVVRSYTMSSSPNQLDHCAVTVKRVEGGLISNWMCDKIEVGTVLRGRGPIGRFTYESEKDRSHLVMVAAGSGVTPFVSIMRDYMGRLGEAKSPKKMTLIVSYRSRKDLLLWKDLDDIAKHKNCKVITTLSRDPEAPSSFHQGRIDESFLKDVLKTEDYGSMTFMSCGPEAIMNLAKTHALNMGVPPEQIKTESFES